MLIPLLHYLEVLGLGLVAFTAVVVTAVAGVFIYRLARDFIGLDVTSNMIRNLLDTILEGVDEEDTKKKRR